MGVVYGRNEAILMLRKEENNYQLFDKYWSSWKRNKLHVYRETDIELVSQRKHWLMTDTLCDVSCEDEMQNQSVKPPTPIGQVWRSHNLPLEEVFESKNIRAITQDANHLWSVRIEKSDRNLQGNTEK